MKGGFHIHKTLTQKNPHLLVLMFKSHMSVGKGAIEDSTNTRVAAWLLTDTIDLDNPTM